MKKNAFTLVELIVGITISILLMVSIGIFVSTGMTNITLQTKILDENKKISSDILYLQRNILNSKKYIGEFNTGILLRQNKYFDKGGFSYIGVKEFDKKYCGTGEITKTNHLYISNFIPLTGVSTGTTYYKSDIEKHQIIRKSDNKIVVGKDIFGDKFSDGDFGTGVFLNSPTGIVEIGSKVVFSDTLNDRILYLSGSQVYTLLDETDGLNEPIGLSYNNASGSLYIANAGAGEILKLSSTRYFTNPQLEIKNISRNNINKLEIEILETTGVLTDSVNLSDYTFLNSSNNSNDFVYLSGSLINYYFINNYNSKNYQLDCDGSNNGKKIVNPSDNIIDCISSGTGKLANLKNTTFSNENITINNIKPLLSENKNYYVKIDNEYFPYFTQGDDDIFTKDDNTLEVIHKDLFYPNVVNDDGSYSEFSTGSFNPNNYKSVFIFSNPIKNFKIDYSLTKDLLNLKLNYYKYLNCFNIDEKIYRTFLVKKSF